MSDARPTAESTAGSSFSYSEFTPVKRKLRKNRQHKTPLPLSPLVLTALGEQLRQEEWFAQCSQLIERDWNQFSTRIPAILCLGLGSPSASPIARIQLAFLAETCKQLNVAHDAISVYDPVFTPEDIALFDDLKMRVLRQSRACFFFLIASYYPIAQITRSSPQQYASCPTATSSSTKRFYELIGVGQDSITSFYLETSFRNTSITSQQAPWKQPRRACYEQPRCSRPTHCLRRAPGRLPSTTPPCNSAWRRRRIYRTRCSKACPGETLSQRRGRRATLLMRVIWTVVEGRPRKGSRSRRILRVLESSKTSEMPRYQDNKSTLECISSADVS